MTQHIINYIIMRCSYELGTEFDMSNPSDLLCKHHSSKANMLEELGFKLTGKQQGSATFVGLLRFFFLKLEDRQAGTVVFNAMICT